MSWFFLILASIFEIVWAISLKLSNGFTNILYTIFFVISAILSVVFLGISLKNIPLSVGYPIWVGLGSVGIFIISVMFLNENINYLKTLAITLIILGVIILKIS